MRCAMTVAGASTQGRASIDFSRFARVPLCHQPTPIEPMVRLSEQLGGPRIFIKRDDCTGLATGGNKTRKLEFLVGEAVSQNADMLVTQGAVQSNHVRQTAAAACRSGMKCHALLERRVAVPEAGYETSGNVFLDRVFGATLEFRPAGLDMNAEALTVAERLRTEGHRPYFIPGGGSNATGALGYACLRSGNPASKPGSTGIVSSGWSWGPEAPARRPAWWPASMRWAIGTCRSWASVCANREDKQIAAVHALAKLTSEKAGGAGSLPASKIQVDDGYVGEGYGHSGRLDPGSHFPDRAGGGDACWTRSTPARAWPV